jgi:hypothetical protein
MQPRIAANEYVQWARPEWDEAMSHLRIRLTDRLRLEPLDVRHTDDLLALYLDPAVAEWYGIWTREQVDREVARIARSWSVDGVHKWMAYHRRDRGARRTRWLVTQACRRP